MNTFEFPRKAMILGRGAQEIKEGGRVVDSRLKRGSLQRVEAMHRYWSAHRKEFTAADAKIVLSGGYARTANGQAPLPQGMREGDKMADYLLENGVPAKLIEVENESGSTTDNFAYTLQRRFFEGEQFGDGNPLILGASKAHGRQRGVPLARAAFGITDPHGVQLLVGERERPLQSLLEQVGGLATEQALAAVQPQPFSAYDMFKVGEQFETITENKAAMLKPFVSDMMHTAVDFAMMRQPLPVDLIIV